MKIGRVSPTKIWIWKQNNDLNLVFLKEFIFYQKCGSLKTFKVEKTDWKRK